MLGRYRYGFGWVMTLRGYTALFPVMSPLYKICLGTLSEGRTLYSINKRGSSRLCGLYSTGRWYELKECSHNSQYEQSQCFIHVQNIIPTHGMDNISFIMISLETAPTEYVQSLKKI